MKISNINFLNINNVYQNNANRPVELNFCAKSPAIKFGIGILKKDIFEKSKTTTQKTVLIKDMNGNPKKAVIKEEELDDTANLFGKNPKRLTINTDGKKLGYIIMYDDKKKNSLYVKELYTEEVFQRHYKGAGTELLKCAVKESKKRGFNGRINLCASNFPAPFVFYYKNNFSAAGECSRYNAAIDYAARNNIPVSKILPVTMTALSMELDEKGAEALLKGKRLYEKRDFKVIATMQAGDEKYQANYIEGTKKDFYLQIIDDTAEAMKQKFVAKGEIEEDRNGEKCLKISMDDTYVSRKIMQFAEDAAQKLAQELGCKRVKMCKDFG